MGGSQTFTASVTGTGGYSPAVTWSLVSGVGSISASGVYTSSVIGSAVVKATSVQDPTKSATASVTVAAWTITSVTVAPATVAIQVNTSQTFTAAVAGTGSYSPAVTWSVVSGVGTINASTGLYTSSTAGSATVKATSVQDPSKSGTAAVTVSATPQLRWKKTMVYGLGQLLSEESASGTIYIQSDQVGSPNILTDANGQVVGRSKNLPFGERFGQTGLKSVRRFTNHEDGDGSAIYMQARTYLPVYGKFAQVDPAYDQTKDDPESWNLYNYVTNNPVTNTDPDGRAESKTTRTSDGNTLTITGTGPEFLETMRIANEMYNGWSAFEMQPISGATGESKTAETQGPNTGTETSGKSDTKESLEAQAGDTSDASADSGTASQTTQSEKSPKFGLGIEVPKASAVSNGTLNAAADPGHTVGYFKDENGKIVGMISFGPGEPIGPTNKNDFKDGKMPGNPNWPLSGNLATWETNISSKQLSQGLSAVASFKANPPNYTPTMQCTSAVLGIASKIGVNLPNGVGPVVARALGQTVFNGNLPNPYALYQQMTTTFGRPMVVPSSSFPSPSGGSKWWQ